MMTLKETKDSTILLVKILKETKDSTMLLVMALRVFLIGHDVLYQCMFICVFVCVFRQVQCSFDKENKIWMVTQTVGKYDSHRRYSNIRVSGEVVWYKYNILHDDTG